MSTIGFIGLGTMGRHMARNLLKGGQRLVFYARRPEVASEFEQAGATRALTPAEVARRSDIVITIVSADPQVREVVLGPDGILASAQAGKVLLEMSTIAPSTAREVGAELAKRGMQMLDAPVSGGPAGAEAGTLTIMVGGEASLFEACRPVLACMGKRFFHLGPLGAGQTVKVVNQMLGGGIMALVGEAFALAKAAGADLAAMADVVRVSSGNSTLFESRANAFILADQYETGFKTELMRKDMLLAMEMASQCRVPVPVAAAALQQYTCAMQQGLRENDFSSVAQVCANAAGVKLVG